MTCVLHDDKSQLARQKKYLTNEIDVESIIKALHMIKLI